MDRDLCESIHTSRLTVFHRPQFVHDTEDPHAKRLANWIVEKMGGEGRPWSKERTHR